MVSKFLVYPIRLILKISIDKRSLNTPFLVLVLNFQLLQIFLLTSKDLYLLYFLNYADCVFDDLKMNLKVKSSFTIWYLLNWKNKKYLNSITNGRTESRIVCIDRRTLIGNKI